MGIGRRRGVNTDARGKRKSEGDESLKQGLLERSRVMDQGLYGVIV